MAVSNSLSLLSSSSIRAGEKGIGARRREERRAHIFFDIVDNGATELLVQISLVHVHLLRARKAIEESTILYTDLIRVAIECKERGSLQQWKANFQRREGKGVP